MDNLEGYTGNHEPNTDPRRLAKCLKAFNMKQRAFDIRAEIDSMSASEQEDDMQNASAGYACVALIADLLLDKVIPELRAAYYETRAAHLAPELFKDL